MQAEDGVITYFASNPTAEEVTLQAGMRVAALEACVTVDAEEILGKGWEPRSEHDGTGKERALMALHALWYALAVTWSVMHGQGWEAGLLIGAVGVCTAAAVAAGISVWKQLQQPSDWSCSIHHAEEDNHPEGSRQTTTRHKPRTRLRREDPRSNESGEQTVARFRRRLLK